jgi:Ser/Thr protein kinase RdoA (MazF antagonist)
MSAEEVNVAFTAISGEGVLRMEKLVGGSPNPSWAVRTASSRYAVRLYPPVWGRVQGSLLRFLAENSYPVPAVVYEGTAGDAHLLALSWVDGVPLAEVLTVSPRRATDLGHAFGTLQAQLHGLAVLPDLCAALPRLEEPCAGTSLLHLDYHPLNALVSGGALSGIIDWENVKLGDPRADVARTLSILATDPAIRALPPELRRGVRSFRRAYCAGYLSEAGADALEGMPPFLAWAGDFMLRDLGKRYDAAGLEPVRRWTAHWR